jgi:hypothetical protein
MRIATILIAIPLFSVAAGTGRVERCNFDLRAPSRQIALHATEGLDTAVEASIRSDGTIPDLSGWRLLLWYGDAATNPPLGVAFTNISLSRGVARWDIPGEQVATNGRFAVQIVGQHTSGRSEEWARGWLAIDANSASSFSALTFGTPGWALTTNVQAMIAAEAQARASGDVVAMTNWQAVVYSMTNGAALGATALQPSWAETGTVSRAIEVIGAQSTLIETAWQNLATAADWAWTSNGREITLTGYSGPNAVVIPDMLDGLPVTGFGGIFTGNTDITSVGGGANIKAVGDYAFVACGALNSVSLPACTTVGDYAFRDCWFLNSVSLPACTTVGTGAFYGCGALNSVSLPACTTVGTDAFYGCGALNSVSLPACTTVGAGAFAYCGALNSVSLPACTTVGAYAFYGCEALISVTFGQNAPAPAANVFEYSTPTIYVSNPHATGWGDTWNGRPVVRAASMGDIASHNTNGLAHADIRAAIDAIPLPPTNAVAGWLVWDAGSNVFWRVSATNLRFYVWP